MKVSSITVKDMIGRYVANENGAEFRIVDVRYYLESDDVVFELIEADEEYTGDPSDTSGVTSLKGWTIL